MAQPAAWTQEEAVAFEAAREAITHLRAVLMHQINQERAKVVPDDQRIAELEHEHLSLHRERGSLHVTDHAAIARIRRDYGARIRAWNDQATDARN